MVFYKAFAMTLLLALKINSISGCMCQFYYIQYIHQSHDVMLTYSVVVSNKQILLQLHSTVSAYQLYSIMTLITALN